MIKKMFDEIKKRNQVSQSPYNLSSPLYIDEKHKRYRKYQNQIKKRKFCDAETWNLGMEVATFLLPRLVRFRELLDVNPVFPSYLNNVDEWKQIIEDIIFFLDLEVNFLEYGGHLNSEYFKLSKKEQNDMLKRSKKGRKLLGEHLISLWT